LVIVDRKLIYYILTLFSEEFFSRSIFAMSIGILQRQAYMGLLETWARCKHVVIAAPIYRDFAEENRQKIPDIDDFMRGARHSFIFVNRNLV